MRDRCCHSGGDALRIRVPSHAACSCSLALLMPDSGCFPFKLRWIINGNVLLMRLTNSWDWQNLVRDRHLWPHAHVMSRSQGLQLYQCPLTCQWLFLKTGVSITDGICTRTPKLFTEILPTGLAISSLQLFHTTDTSNITKFYWIKGPNFGPAAEAIPCPERNTALLTLWFWPSENCSFWIYCRFKL